MNHSLLAGGWVGLVGGAGRSGLLETGIHRGASLLEEGVGEAEDGTRVLAGAQVAVHYRVVTGWILEGVETESVEHHGEMLEYHGLDSFVRYP